MLSLFSTCLFCLISLLTCSLGNASSLASQSSTRPEPSTGILNTSQSVACPKTMNAALSSNFDQSGMCSYSSDQNSSNAWPHQLLPAPRCERSEISRLKIVAAENFYGGIAQQIGGSAVAVMSIVSNPNQDPHEFQTTASIAKAVADADIVIYNGIGYDAWMEKLLAMRGKPHRLVINVAHLVGAKPGDNPHLWYDPKTMITLAKKLAQVLQQPTTLQVFSQEMKPLFDKMDLLSKTYRNLAVTATEPLFGPMAKILGWKMLNVDYQWAIMNGTEPSFQQTAEYEKSLTTKKVQMLFYNSQVTNPATEKVQRLAQKNKIPVIGITETQPAITKTYQEWMLGELSKVEKALLSAHE